MNLLPQMSPTPTKNTCCLVVTSAGCSIAYLLYLWLLFSPHAVITTAAPAETSHSQKMMLCSWVLEKISNKIGFCLVSSCVVLCMKKFVSDMSLILRFPLFFFWTLLSLILLSLNFLDLLESRLSAHTLSGCVRLPKFTSLLHWIDVFCLHFYSTDLCFRFCRVFLIRMTGQWQKFGGERWREFAFSTVKGWCGSYWGG